MRRHAVVMLACALLGGAALSHAWAAEGAEQDPRAVAALGTVDLHDFDWSDAAGLRAPSLERGNLPDADAALYESDDPAWHTVVRAVRASRVRLVVTAFRVTGGGGAASDVFASDDVILGAGAIEDVRAAVSTGALRRIGRVATTGRFHDVLRGIDGKRSQATAEYDLETAIEAAISFPISEEVRSGLSVAARAAPHVGGARALAFHVRAVGKVATTTVRSAAGRREDLSAPVFVARGALVLRDGDVGCVRGIDANGEGFVFLLRLQGSGVAARRAPRLPIAVGDDHIAVPTAVLCRVQRAVPVSGTFGAWFEEPFAPGRIVPWTDKAATRAREIDDVLRSEGLAFDDVVGRMRGLALVRTQPGAARATLRHARAILDARSNGVLVARAPAHGRIVVPSLDGGAPNAFLGTVGTRSVGLQVETGCHSCIAAAELIEYDWTGMTVAAGGAPGQPTRVDIATRTRVSSSRRAFPVRRLLPGLASFVYDQLAFDWVADTQLRVRSLLPPGGATFAEGVAVTLLGRAQADIATTGITVNGESLFVAPGEGARMRRTRSAPAVVGWEWVASCGMSLRYPEVTGITSGIDVAVRADESGATLEIIADLRGEPERLAKAFDMGDGAIDILRVPRLLVEAEIPTGGARRIAWGSGLALRVGVTDRSDRPPLRTAIITTHDGRSGVRFSEGTRVVLEAGGSTLLPIEILDYQSNHLSGEGATVTRRVRDGVVFVLGRARDHVARGWATLRGSGSRRAFSLRKFQAPRRPDTAVNLLLPKRLVRTVPVTVAHGRVLTLSYGLSAPVHIAVERTTVEEDE